MINSINQLKLPPNECNKLSKNVIDFYENTSSYEFELKTKWNPIFKFFGYLLKILFSNRIEQLNIPMNNKNKKGMNSDIIQLIDKKTKQVKRTIWLRTFKETKQVVYSGVYETCTIPNGTTCIKAMFPLPNGNASVVMTEKVEKRWFASTLLGWKKIRR